MATYHTPGSELPTPPQHSPPSQHSTPSQHSEHDINSHQTTPQHSTPSQHSEHGNNSDQTPPPPQDAIEAVLKRCHDICREWLLILYALFGILVLQSEAGKKMMNNPIYSVGMTLVYIVLDVVYIYRVYKVLLVGPKLPLFEMRQVKFILYCCFFVTAVNMYIITYQFLPWGIVVREEYRWIVAVFFTPIWSVLWGCLWIVPVLAQTSWAVSVSSMPF